MPTSLSSRSVYRAASARKLGERAHFAVDLDRAAMLLRDDVVADREAKPGALAGRLRGEERLEQLVLDLGRDADAVVADTHLDRVAQIARCHRQLRLELRVASLLLALGGGVKA